MKTYYYFYQITNLVNNKIYVGVHKTSNLDDRYMGSGKVIQRAIEKYGVENFKKEILEWFNTPQEMFAYEKQIVTEEFLKRKDVYNLRRGGYGGFDYINKKELNLYGKNGQVGYGGENLKKSVTKYRLIEQGRYEAYLLKISEALKSGYKSGRIKKSFLNKRHSIETKKKIGLINSALQKGEGNSQYGTMWVTNGTENKKIKKHDVVPQGWNKGRTCKF